jgi:hypothetical protein
MRKITLALIALALVGLSVAGPSVAVADCAGYAGSGPCSAASGSGLDALAGLAANPASPDPEGVGGGTPASGANTPQPSGSDSAGYDGLGGLMSSGSSAQGYGGPGSACYAGPGGPCYAGPGGNPRACPVGCR